MLEEKFKRSMQFTSICLSILLFHVIIYACDRESTTPKVNWDGLVFSQVWPITACIRYKDEKNGASCNIYPNMTSWTVHGLWPTKFGEKGPNNCNVSWAFNEAKLAYLEPRLIKYWTNIYADTAEDSLWKHEWNKHGTCAAESLLMNSEQKYFTEGLRLVMKYDFVSILARRGIYPSDEEAYSLKEIAQAITGFTETSTIIDCIYDKKTKRHELWQMKICLDKQLFPMDCDVFLTHAVRGNCPKEGIFYPSSVVSGGRTFNYTRHLVNIRLDKFQKEKCVSVACQFFRAALKTSLFSSHFKI